jgi:hypothetical protein
MITIRKPIPVVKTFDIMVPKILVNILFY